MSHAQDGIGDRTSPRVEVYRRDDRRWSWRLFSATGVLLARDAGEGFAKRSQAEGVVDRIISGDFRECPIIHVTGHRSKR